MDGREAIHRRRRATHVIYKQGETTFFYFFCCCVESFLYKSLNLALISVVLLLD